MRLEASCKRQLIIGTTRFFGRHLVEACCFDVVVAPEAEGGADEAIRQLPLLVKIWESGSG